jgi:hypothetical protein
MTEENFVFHTDHDNEFKMIDHFKLHPEMLPYVGTQYKDFRILLIGESHYLNNSYKDKEYLFDKWYSISTAEIQWNDESEDPYWFNTRWVINNYLSRKRGKGHGIFAKPSKVFCEKIKEKVGVTINDCDAFSCFAFFNYFQRPCINRGGSFNPTELDKCESKKIALNTIKILNPRLIIFVSKKAFDYFSESTPKCSYVNHPTCKQWSNSISQNGEAKFTSLLDTYFKESDLSQIKEVLNAAVESKRRILINLFTSIEDHLRQDRKIVIGNYIAQIEAFYNDNGKNVYPYIDCLIKHESIIYSLHIEVSDFIYYGICVWDEEKKTIREPAHGERHTAHTLLNPYCEIRREKMNYCWLQYLPDEERKINFTGRAENLMTLSSAESFNTTVKDIILKIDNLLEGIAKLVAGNL